MAIATSVSPTRERRLMGRDCHGLSCTPVTFISAFSCLAPSSSCFFRRLCPPSGTLVSLPPSCLSSLTPTGSGSPFSPPPSHSPLFLEAAPGRRGGGKLEPISSCYGWEPTATGDWQGFVIGRAVKGWKGAERMEVTPGKLRAKGSRKPCSRGGME